MQTVESRTEAPVGSADPLPRLMRLLGYLAQDASNAQLLAEVADLHLQLGQWASARRQLQQLLVLQPGDALAGYRLAVAERALGHPRLAIELLTPLIEQGIADPVVLMEAANAHAQLGDWASTSALLAELDVAALPVAQGDAAWLLRIRARHHQGDLARALVDGQAWQLAREGRPLPIAGLAALATLYLDAEQLDALAQVLAQCGASQLKGNAELQMAAGYLALARGEPERAADHFSHSSRLQPESGRSHLGLGLAAAVQGHKQQAIASLREATRVAPAHLGGWHVLAWQQLLGGDLAGAAASFASALEQDRNFGETHGGLALMAALRGERALAAEQLLIAQRLDRHSVNAAVARRVLEQPEFGLRNAALLQETLQQLLEPASAPVGHSQDALSRALSFVAKARGG